MVEARRGQLAMAAVPGGDGDGAARSGPAPGQPPHRLTSREGKWLRLAARRAHVALPPDRITKAGLPTSGPRGRCCWPKSRSTDTRSSRDPPAQLGNRKPSLVWCTRTMQQLEEEGLFRAQEQEERREYGLTRGGERMGALTGPRSSQTPWEGVARARTTPQLGDLIVQEDAAFVHVARTVTPQQMAEARMCWPIPPGEPVPDSG